MDDKQVQIVLLTVLLGASIVHSIYMVASRYSLIKETAGFDTESRSLLLALVIILGLLNFGMFKLYMYALEVI